jgi:hypothetical protein
MMSILLHVMARGVDTHTTASIIADLDYIQKFHFVPMSQSELGWDFVVHVMNACLIG